MSIYLSLTFVLYLCLAGQGTDSFDLDKDPEYKNFLTHLVQTIKRDSQKFMTDHGYGSRLRAGTNVADAVTAYDNVYGVYGPGKRSVALEETDYDLASGDEEESVLEFPELSKRYLSDHGYGSRVTAGRDIARAKLMKDNLFGAGGPGKRSSLMRHTRSGGQIGDAGYLSRIDAAKKLAYDDEARYNIFGSMGPGRRR